MNLALFDFDHTLTRNDTYGAFLRRIATPEQMARAKWSVGPWVAGYRLGLISAARLRARVTRLVFEDRSEHEVLQAGERYCEEALPGMVRPDMLERLRRHAASGDTVVVVSGSLDAYLRPWCARYGAELICNRLEAVDGQLTGRYQDGDFGADKVRHIRARYDVAAYPTVSAYGDSREDRGMLALAQERWYRGKRVA